MTCLEGYDAVLTHTFCWKNGLFLAQRTITVSAHNRNLVYVKQPTGMTDV